MSQPAPRRFRKLRWAVAAGLAAALLPFVAAAWLLTTEAGLGATAWLLQRASAGRVSAKGVEGRLIGPMTISELSAGEVLVRGLRMDWSPAELLDRRIRVRSLEADELRLAQAPAAGPARLPERLDLPVALRADRIAIGRLTVVEAAPEGSREASPEPVAELTGIEATLDSDGRVHRIERLALGHALGRIETAGSLEAAKPYPLNARASLAGRRDGRDFRVEAEFGGTLERVMASAKVSGYEVAGTVEATLTPFAALPFERARIETEGVDPSILADGAPRAKLRVRADLVPLAGADAAKGLAVTGPIEIANAMPGPIDRDRLPLVSAGATLTWRDQSLDLADLRLILPGGMRASGRAGWRNGAAQVDVAVRALDLKALHGKLRPTRLDGRIAAAGDVQAQSMSARLREPRFEAEFDAELSAGQLRVSRARVQARGAIAEVSGTLGLDGRRPFSASGRLADFDPAAFAEVPAARVNAVFEARGSLEPTPLGEVRFDLGEGSVLRGERLSGGGTLALAEGNVVRADVTLRHGPNRLAAAGGVGRAGERLKFDLDAPRLETLGAGVAGRARASGALEGWPGHPGGEFEIEASALRMPGGQSIGTLTARGRLASGEDGVVEVRARVGAVRSDPKAPPLLETADVELEGRRSRHRLRLRIGLAEAREVAAELEGGLSAGNAWSGTLAAFRLAGKGFWNAELVNGAPLQIARERAALGAARVRTRLGELRHDSSEWTPSGWRSRGRLEGLLVRLTAEGLRTGEGREATLALKGDWDVSVGERVEGVVRMERVSGDLVAPADPPLALGLDRLEIEAKADGARLEARAVARGSLLGTVQAKAAAMLGRTAEGWRIDRQAALEGELRAQLPSVAWLGPILGGRMQTEGRLEAEATLAGTLDERRVTGTVRGERLAVRAIDQGLRLAEGRLDLGFDEKGLKLRELVFVGHKGALPRTRRFDAAGLYEPPGTLRAEGSLAFADESADLRVTAERVPLLQRPEQWVMVSGRGDLRLREGRIVLSGKIGADAGYWELPPADRPRLGDDVVVKGRSEPRRHGYPVALDLEVDLGRRFFLVGRGLDARLGGSVRLRADPGGTLRANGSIRTRDGTFDAYGIALALDRGEVNFQGPLDNPGLNILALRKGLPVEAGVSVGGTVLSPRIRLVSTPDVPDVEKLSWLTLGRGHDQSEGGADTALLLTAAQALLGSTEGGGGGLARIRQALGETEFGISTGKFGKTATHLPSETVAGRLSSQDAGGTDSQVLTVGHRLTSQVYLSVEQSLADLGTVVKLTLQIDRRLSVTASAGSDNAIDLFYTFSYD